MVMSILISRWKPQKSTMPSHDSTGISEEGAVNEEVLPQAEASTSVRSVAKQPVPKLGVFYGGIGDVGRQTENVKQQATNLLTNEAPKIQGLEQSAKRIANMLPGLREANRLQTNLKTLSAGNIAGVIGILMLALSIYQQINRIIEEQQRQKEEYKREIMRAQNLTSQSQYQTWQTQQETALANYRNRPVIK